MLDFGDTLMMYGLEANTILLNICVDLMTLSTMFEEMGRLIFSMKYRIPRILR